MSILKRLKSAEALLSQVETLLVGVRQELGGESNAGGADKPPRRYRRKHSRYDYGSIPSQVLELTPNTSTLVH